MNINLPLLITVAVLVLIVIGIVLRNYREKRRIQDSYSYGYESPIFASRRRWNIKGLFIIGGVLLLLATLGYLIFYMFKALGTQTALKYIAIFSSVFSYLVVSTFIYSRLKRIYLNIKSSNIESATLTWGISLVLVLTSLVSFYSFLYQPLFIRNLWPRSVSYFILIWTVCTIGSVIYALMKMGDAGRHLTVCLEKKDALEKVISDIEISLRRKNLKDKVHTALNTNDGTSSPVNKTISLLEQYDALLESMD